MKIRFTYDQDYDIQNYITASKSVNNSQPSKMQSAYMAKCGKIFHQKKLKRFITAYIQESGLDMKQEKKRIESNWRRIENETLKRMERIFRIPSQAQTIKIYLTTDGRCSYNIQNKYFFVSVSRANQNLTILHELMHFWTWWAFGNEVKRGILSESQYNNLKESLTVLLNVEFKDLLHGSVDAGYPQHQKIREIMQQDWMKTKNIRRVFSNAKKCIKAEEADIISNRKIISEEKAWEIVQQFADELKKKYKKDILGLYVIGSLGGGYYRPGYSDIDTLILKKDDSRLTVRTLEALAKKYVTEYAIPKGFGAILIKEKELWPPYKNSYDYEFTVEIARLKKQGILIYGSYDLSKIPMPKKSDLIADAKRMENFFNEEFVPNMFDSLSYENCVATILIYMKRFLMINKSIFEFNKFRVISLYKKHSIILKNKKVFYLIEEILQGYRPNHREVDALKVYGNKLRSRLNSVLLTTA